MLQALQGTGLPVAATDKSISSSALTCLNRGDGLTVRTQNISRITAPVYANAMVTAGVGDAAVLVAAPTAIVLLADDEPPPAPQVRVEQVPVGSLPTDIAFAQGRAWVPSAGSDRLLAIDDEPEPRRGAAYPARSGALRVASDGLTIWLAGALGNSLTSVDPLFGGEAGRHRIPIGRDAVDVAVGADATWVSNGASGTVTRVDPVSERALGPPIRTGRFPTAIAAGARDVWVVNSGDGTLARIDPRENLVVGRRVEVGRDPQDVAVGFGSVWVANRGDGTLTRIEERSGRPQRTIRVGGAPSALAITSEAVLALDSQRARVIRLDPRTLEVTDVVEVGGFPTAVAIGENRSLWTVDARRGVVTRVSR
jgi:streptogramin lyase